MVEIVIHERSNFEQDPTKFRHIKKYVGRTVKSWLMLKQSVSEACTHVLTLYIYCATLHAHMDTPALYITHAQPAPQSPATQTYQGSSQYNQILHADTEWSLKRSRGILDSPSHH